MVQNDNYCGDGGGDDDDNSNNNDSKGTIYLLD